MSVSFMLSATNPANAKIKLDGLDEVSLDNSLGADLSEGALNAGQIYTITYDGTAFRINNVAHATEADNAASADEATHATSSDSATTATSADTAANYTSDGGIATEFNTISSEISDLSGAGRTTETVKSNADNIATLTTSLENLSETALPAADYTAADVLAKIETVDGTGSGLDADTLDGLDSSDFATAAQGVKADAALPADSYTAADVLSKIEGVDGSGSGLDADTLDGLDSINFASANDMIFQTASGTTTAITLSDVTLTDGYSKTFIASANNSGAATTINDLPVYKANSTTAPTIVAGKAYTIWYNAAGNCFFVKASAEGTATAADVLAGKTFSNDDDSGLTGTLALSGTATAANVLSGKTFYSTDRKKQTYRYNI